MPRILIASNNRGKLAEIQALVRGAAFELVTPAMLGLHLEVPEDGASYAENASLKALSFARLAQMMTLADDSGLEVDCLGGDPGLHSARYAPHPGATDADRRAILLSKLASHPPPWTARFRCTLALGKPDGQVYLAEGVCEGEIIPQERGQNGFGYDPVFLLPSLGRTMAELTLDQKNRLSHRARAVQAALPEIYRWLGLTA